MEVSSRPQEAVNTVTLTNLEGGVFVIIKHCRI